MHRVPTFIFKYPDLVIYFYIFIHQFVTVTLVFVLFQFCMVMIVLNLTGYTNKMAVGGASFTAPSCFGTVSSLFLGTYEPSNESGNKMY